VVLRSLMQPGQPGALLADAAVGALAGCAAVIASRGVTG
jgi:hypothetical protein